MRPALAAATALHALNAGGIRVPHDLSLVALADTALTWFADPPITAAHVSPELTSRIAVDLIVEMLAGRKPRRIEHLVPIEIAVRESTCALTTTSASPAR